MRTYRYLVVAAFFIVVACERSEAPATQPATSPAAQSSTAGVAQLTVDDARTIAQEGYTFGLPLVYIATQKDVMTNVAKPQGTRAPVNQFVHYRQFPTAKNREIVGYNVDTLYSISNLDLSKEPIVLSVPPMGDRFWLMQIVDAWNDVPAAPGARTVDGKGGDFVLVGPLWKGPLPSDLTPINVSTSIAMVGGRTYSSGKDYDAVHRLQDQYRLVPLSKWGTDYVPPSDVPVTPGINATISVPKQVFAMSVDAYFNRLAQLLVDNPPHEDDAPMMQQLARLGVVPGKPFEFERLSPVVRTAVEEGMRAGQKEIVDGWTTVGEKVNGWQVARDLGRYGTRYPYRATWTYFGVGGNLAEDALYPTTAVDSTGANLTGANKYVVTFPKGQLPPVNGFWSITMYDSDSYLVDNPINRYALSSRDPLKQNADGSTTLYVQHVAPGGEKQGNWLPASAGEFRLAMRMYWPKKEATDGAWKPPAVSKVQ